ncbi:MAG: HIT family protein [Campylobacterales bacterium]|nr:HIT family protein [Campylobacterales bacterium]
MSNIIFENSIIKVEIEPSQIPWLKIFTQEPIKEFSMCDKQTKHMIWEATDIIETNMLEYFKCDKINIASFGNYVPHVHFHIMARFKNDNFFPEPMWGKQQRDNNLTLAPLAPFYKDVATSLSTL